MNIHYRIVQILLVTIFTLGLTYAQRSDQDHNKEVTVTVNEKNGTKTTTLSIKSGDGTVQDFEWQGDQMPSEIQQKLDDQKIDLNIQEESTIVEKTITEKIITEKKNGTEKKIMKVIIKDDNGEKIIEWEGDEEMPEEMRQKIEALEALGGEPGNTNKIVIRKGNGEEKVFEWEGEDMPEEIQNQLKENELDEILQIDVSKSQESKAFLGVALAQTVEKLIENEVESSSTKIEITEVIGGSGAESAGLLKGDQITAVNNLDVHEANEVVNNLDQFKPGDIVPITILRDRQEMTLNVKLTERTSQPVHQKKEIIIEKEVKEIPAVDPEVKSINSLQIRELKIHPNPSKEILNVSFKGVAAPLIISLQDLQGKLLLEQKIENFNGHYQDELNLSGFPKGALIITFEQNGKKHSEKIIRQ
ncbi:MAG: PDZ domain-containing protein [Saprospiraceae bacterium]|nr:PDZ domain-containing protein [Saprospiraceae bacterium]